MTIHPTTHKSEVRPQSRVQAFDAVLHMKTRIAILIAVIALSQGTVFYGEELDAQTKRAIALFNDQRHAERCQKAFVSLRQAIKSPMTSSDLLAALRDKDWVSSAIFSEVGGTTGSWPDEFRMERGALSHATIYPNEDGWSSFRFYFTLSVDGIPPVELHSANFSAYFFAGKISHPTCRIQQIMLCHPGPTMQTAGKTEILPKSIDGADIHGGKPATPSKSE